MIRTIEVETNDNFEGCDDCIYDYDAIEVCKMRGCIHAIEKGDIKECYQPKERMEEYTISKSMLYACVNCMARLEKIEKIINKPIQGELARIKAIKDIREVLQHD